jgi:hypothetical protein
MLLYDDKAMKYVPSAGIVHTADPSCRQRGRPAETRLRVSDSNLPTGSNIWSEVPEWARHQDILTDWPSVIK